MHETIGVLIVFCVVVSAVLCLWKRKQTRCTNHITRPVAIVSPTATTPWESVRQTQLPWMPWNWIDRFQANIANSRAGGSNINVLFYGDSITEGIDQQIWNRVFAPLGAANYGISCDATQHILWRIQNGEIDGLSPRIVVLMIGTNNIGSYVETDIARGITTIVDELLSRLPNTRILLLGLLPRTNSNATAIVERINAIIASRENFNNVRFLNMREGFCRENGKFFTELYRSNDLLHINAAGYARWEELMNPLFTQMWNTLQPEFIETKSTQTT